MGVELVDTTRLWMRRASILEPEWVELVAPHLCESHYSGARWDREQGAVYAVERVVCGGLRIIDNRRVHYGRINPAHAREIMIREGLLGGGFRTKPACIRHLETLREEVRQIELKLRRPDQVWCEEGVFEFFNRLVPPDCCTARAFCGGPPVWRRKIRKLCMFRHRKPCTNSGGKTCWMVFRMKSPVKERNMPCITRMIPARKMTV